MSQTPEQQSHHLEKILIFLSAILALILLSQLDLIIQKNRTAEENETEADSTMNKLKLVTVEQLKAIEQIVCYPKDELPLHPDYFTIYSHSQDLSELIFDNKYPLQWTFLVGDRADGDTGMRIPVAELAHLTLESGGQHADAIFKVLLDEVRTLKTTPNAMAVFLPMLKNQIKQKHEALQSPATANGEHAELQAQLESLIKNFAEAERNFLASKQRTTTKLTSMSRYLGALILEIAQQKQRRNGHHHQRATDLTALIAEVNAEIVEISKLIS